MSAASHSEQPAKGAETRLFIAWAVSVIATLGSLYLSEIKGFLPCDLCWFQRIFMYPLTILLGIAYFKDDVGIAKYVLPLSFIGGYILVSRNDSAHLLGYRQRGGLRQGTLLHRLFELVWFYYNSTAGSDRIYYHYCNAVGYWQNI